jgi:hypothetical protein
MEDQDRETRIDEDVEGHVHHEPHAGAPHAGQNEDADAEGEDVEGHVHHAPNLNAPNLNREDEDDDVEGHVHLNAPKINAPKIN